MLRTILFALGSSLLFGASLSGQDNAPAENQITEQRSLKDLFGPLSEVELEINKFDVQVDDKKDAINFSELQARPYGPLPHSPKMTGWESSVLAHHPLYYEEIYLERDGVTFEAYQPAVSAGLFFGRTLTLPLRMTMQPPFSAQLPANLR